MKTYRTERERIIHNLNHPPRAWQETFIVVGLTAAFVMVCGALVWAMLPR